MRIDDMVFRNTDHLSAAGLGAWMRLVRSLERSPTPGTETLSPVHWANEIKCQEAEVDGILTELADRGVILVTRSNGVSNSAVTLSCQWLIERAEARKSLAKRVAKHRRKNISNVKLTRNCQTEYVSCCLSLLSCQLLKKGVVGENIADKIASLTKEAASLRAAMTDEERFIAQAHILADFYADNVKEASLDTSRHQAKISAANLLATGEVEFLALATAIINYAEVCRTCGKEMQYRKNVGNFLGRERIFETYLPKVFKTPAKVNGVTPKAVAPLVPHALVWDEGPALGELEPEKLRGAKNA